MRCSETSASVRWAETRCADSSSATLRCRLAFASRSAASLTALSACAWRTCTASNERTSSRLSRPSRASSSAYISYDTVLRRSTGR